MNYFNKILNGNIPANIFDLIKNNKLDYKLNQEYPYLQINTNDTNNNAANLLHVALIKKSMKLNYNNIVSSVNSILKKSLKIAIDNNKNEIAKMLVSTNDGQINVIINLVVKTFSNELVKLISKLPLTHHFKDLHVKLIELSGLTGLSLMYINNIAGKISLDYELSKTLKITTSINIQQVFYNILTAEANTCKDISFECLFTEEYINKLGLTVINTWEVILDSIIKLIKYDKIVSFYAFSIDFVDQLHQTTHDTIKPRIVEHAVDIGNTTVNSDSRRMKDLTEKSKEINQSKVIEGVAKLLSSSITSAVSKNQADLLRTIAISNEISLEKVKGSSFTISGIKQTNVVTQETNMNVAQTITNKVTNDISKNMKENIEMAAKTSTTDMTKFSDESKSGTNYGGVINTVADAATKILSAAIGNTTINKTEEEITKELKEQYKLNQDFKYNKNSEANTLIENTLNSENLAKCAADTKANNKMNFKDLNISGPIEITNIEQANVVNDVMNCAFDQAVINEIATKIVDEYDSTIKQLLENVDSSLDEQTKANIEGDIYAMGVAGSAILESVGNAGTKLIDSGGKAGSALLSGAGDLVEKGGEAAKNVGMGLAMVPLAIGFGVFLCIIAIGLMIYFASGGPSTAAATSTGVDVPKGDYELPVETDATSMNGDTFSDAPNPMASDQFSETSSAYR